MKNAIAISALCLLLPACSPSSSQAQDAVRASLKDEDSAKFGAFKVSDDGQRACLGVNAKNSLGGYTGEQQAHLQLQENKWENITVEDQPQDACVLNWLTEDGGLLANDTMMTNG